jgi:hypothetical protein
MKKPSARQEALGYFLGALVIIALTIEYMLVY